MAKMNKIYDENGKEICGAKVKSKFNKRGKVRTNTICHRRPMANGRCYMHGGKSTGPKNSIAYYKKTLLSKDTEALDIENPMDLVGDIGLVRTLLTRMADNPLKAYCQDCRQWVTVNIECPNKECDNAKRAKDGKRPVSHFVSVKDNDYSDMVKATKLLSDIVKNHKEIQQGKEITIRIEILNLIVNRVVEAYERANIIEDSAERRRVFIETVDRLLLDESKAGTPAKLAKV